MAMHADTNQTQTGELVTSINHLSAALIASVALPRPPGPTFAVQVAKVTETPEALNRANEEFGAA